MIKIKPVLLELSGRSSAAGLTSLVTRAMEPGFIFHVDLVSVENDTTAATIAKVGIERSGRFCPGETITLTSAGYFYPFDSPITILSTDRIRVDFSSAGNNTLCNVLVVGYLTPAEP
jgi:hypothetical protein